MIRKINIYYQSLSKQVKTSLWVMICLFFQRGISLLTTPIFTRLLSTLEYGQYNVFNTWMSILSIFITINLNAGVYTQGLIKFESDRNRFISSIQGLTLSLVSVWTVTYFIFRNNINAYLGLSTTQMLCMLILLWTTEVFSFWTVEKRVQLEYKLLVIITILASVLKPILSIILIFISEDKVTARILGITIVQIVFYSYFYIYHLKRGKVFYDRFYWYYALSFNIPLIPHYLSQTVLNGADRIMIDRMVGAAEAGIYSLAYSIANIMLIFNKAMLATLSPWIYERIKNHKIEDIKRISTGAILIVGVLNLLAIGFAPEILFVFAPSTYYEAKWIIPLVSAGVYFIFLYNIFSTFEFYYKKTVMIAVSSSVCAVLNIILNFIFINKYGYFAAGYTTLVCYICYALLHYFAMLKVCREEAIEGNPIDSKKMSIISVGFIVLTFIFLLSYFSDASRYALLVSILTLTIGFRNYIRRFLFELKRK